MTAAQKVPATPEAANPAPMEETEPKTSQDDTPVTDYTGHMVKLRRKNASRDRPHSMPGTVISVATPSGDTYSGRVIASMRSFHDAEEGRCNITTSVLLTGPVKTSGKS